MLSIDAADELKNHMIQWKLYDDFMIDEDVNEMSSLIWLKNLTRDIYAV